MFHPLLFTSHHVFTSLALLFCSALRGLGSRRWARSASPRGQRRRPHTRVCVFCQFGLYILSEEFTRLARDLAGSTYLKLPQHSLAYLEQ